MPHVLRRSSSDVETVQETWSEFVPSARVQALDPQRCRFAWASAQVADFSVIRYELSAGVRSTVQPEDQLLACRVVVEDGWVNEARRDLDPRSPWACSDAPVLVGWEDMAEVRAFVFHRAAAQQLASRLTGDDRLELRVTDSSPISSTAGALWENVHRHVHTSLATLAAPGETHALLEAELTRHALVTTLTTFPTTFLRALESPAQRSPAPTTARRAAAFMDEHARLPITIDDVAQSVHISTRGLQYAFKREFGVSPREYLRRARIAGAHDDLVRGVGSVAQIARRWGFLHVSRFATYYRAEYGVHPRDTLQRV